jgi:hypothetical protein
VKSEDPRITRLATIPRGHSSISNSFVIEMSISEPAIVTSGSTIRTAAFSRRASFLIVSLQRDVNTAATNSHTIKVAVIAALSGMCRVEVTYTLSQCSKFCTFLIHVDYTHYKIPGAIFLKVALRNVEISSLPLYYSTLSCVFF